MTDPDAWMQDISAIVRQKNQAKQDAATLKHDREQHLIAEYEKVRQLVKGQPTEAFEQFGSFLNSEGETGEGAAGGLGSPSAKAARPALQAASRSASGGNRPSSSRIIMP